MNPASDVARSRARSVSEILFTVLPRARVSQGMCPPGPIPISAAIACARTAMRAERDAGAELRGARCITIRSGGLQNSWVSARSLPLTPAAPRRGAAARVNARSRCGLRRGARLRPGSAAHPLRCRLPHAARLGPATLNNARRAPRRRRTNMNALTNFIASHPQSQRRGPGPARVRAARRADRDRRGGGDHVCRQRGRHPVQRHRRGDLVARHREHRPGPTRPVPLRASVQRGMR